jgi:hypothetical protein
MENITGIKKKIDDDWQSAFPQLKIFKSNRLYKVIGPLICGIDLIRLGHQEDYRPYFVIYSLWEDSIADCLKGPYILLALKNKKGLEFSIPYIRHGHFLNEAVESAKANSLLSFDRDVMFSELEKAVDQYSALSSANRSALRAALLQFLVNCALYIGEKELINRMLEKIYNESESWNMQHFNLWHKDFRSWFSSLNEKVADRDVFMQTVERNKIDRKIVSLPGSKLVT